MYSLYCVCVLCVCALMLLSRQQKGIWTVKKLAMAVLRIYACIRGTSCKSRPMRQKPNIIVRVLLGFLSNWARTEHFIF